MLLALAAHSFAADEYGSNSSNVNIPDNGGWVYSTINISGAPTGATITGIEVFFDIEHPYSGDVVLDLEVGTYSNSARLWNREGGAADDPSATKTTSAFNGLPVNNTWYLYARDYEVGDAGYIDRWTITIYYDAAEPTTYTISPNPATVEEGSGSVTFTISRWAESLPRPYTPALPQPKDIQTTGTTQASSTKRLISAMEKHRIQ